MQEWLVVCIYAGVAHAGMACIVCMQEWLMQEWLVVYMQEWLMQEWLVVCSYAGMAHAGMAHAGMARSGAPCFATTKEKLVE